MKKVITMKTYLIVGAGRSGIDAAKLLLQLGKDFVLFDGNTSLDTAAVCERIGKPDCRFILGALGEGDLDGIDVCVTQKGSPSGARSNWPTAATRARSLPLPVPTAKR